MIHFTTELQLKYYETLYHRITTKISNTVPQKYYLNIKHCTTELLLKYQTLYHRNTT